jgi:hypothetical protein
MNPQLSWMEDEHSLGRQLGTALPPLRKFDLAGWGIDPQQFLQDFAPSLDNLAWDPYDVKADQLRFLSRHFPQHKDRLKELTPAYFAGRAGDEEIRELIHLLPAEEQVAFAEIQPYRQRAVARFHVVLDDPAKPRIDRFPVAEFSQNVGADEYRSLKRVFPEVADRVTAHPAFAQLLLAVAWTVQELEPDRAALEIVFHQMRTVVRPGKATVVPPGKPTQVVPEGIHQDGAPYIVSALVVEREGVVGGESVVYGPDKQTVYLATILQPGEGIFQADTGSPLWHYVSPLYFDASSPCAVGQRGIFGFDIHLGR